MEEDSGGRICYFYPRLSPITALSETAAGFQREENLEVTKPTAAIALRAAFVAMPYTDGNDSQPVLCYRSYFRQAVRQSTSSCFLTIPLHFPISR